MNTKRKIDYTTDKKLFQKAFLPSSADGSQGLEICTEDEEAPKYGASLSDTSLGKSEREPLGYGEGLSSRLSLLEGVIHDLAITGNSEGLRIALKEYFLLWVSLARRGT